ncbi:MAG: cell wall hydrolase, partial [Pseudomonadota bacterium]
RFFHAAWYKANFNNIHYVLTTGGNAFYEKRRPENVTRRRPLPNTEGVTGGGGSIVLAQASRAAPKRRRAGLVRGLVSRLIN